MLVGGPWGLGGVLSQWGEGGPWLSGCGGLSMVVVGSFAF